MTATFESRVRRLIVGEHDPAARYPIPEEEAFFDGEHGTWRDFLEDKSLTEIGGALIRRKLTHLDDGEFTCEFLWKRRGGVSRGNAMLGNCVRLSGAAKHYANSTTMLVYLAADHCFKYTRWQIEALVYHELLKVDRQEKFKEDKATGKMVQQPTVYRVLGPDFSGFYEEMHEYGLWQRQLARLSEAVQMAFPWATEI